MIKFGRFVLWIVGFVIAAWFFIYFVFHFSSSSFQEGTMGNLFATILGVVGIPIALELNRMQQNFHMEQENINKERDKTKRTRKILTLIKSELTKNIETVEKCRLPLLEEKNRAVFTGGLVLSGGVLAELLAGRLKNARRLTC